MAATFQHPFQCIQFLRKQKAENDGLLIASAGSRIYSYVASTGQRLAVWPDNSNHSGNEGEVRDDAALDSNGHGPPEKKRKISTDPGNGNGHAAEIAVGWSSIPLLATSPGGDYLVALTAEDKCVRVFQVEDNGSLRHLSARPMPKRPCAIAITTDGKTILIGDKFGDVYSLPLLPDESKKAVGARDKSQKKVFQPSATTLTVHTKRNLEALEQQVRQSNQSASGEKAGGLSFEHEILLGHVSMLTDLAFVSLPYAGTSRTYLLTADRDEHIRVSRGPSQAHVIENYCLGHTSFITKLCVPSWAPERLISGGGDNYLLVWDWLAGRITQTISLADHYPGIEEVTVRGIWAATLTIAANGTSKARVILVAVEGSAKLLCYLSESSGTLKFHSAIQLSGNALSLTSIESEGVIIVSVDGIREAGSTQTWRTNATPPQALLQAWLVRLTGETLNWVSAHESAIDTIRAEGTTEVSAPELKQQKELNDSIYNLGNLRKRSSADEE